MASSSPPSKTWKDTYDQQYEKWVPWLEDVYLRWFTKDNKASYTAKQNLDKTKVTGVSQVDTLQDGANNLAAGQVGQGGLLQPAGDAVSREGLTRAERQGKGEDGAYVGSSVPGAGVANGVAGGVAQGGKKAGEAVGGLFGGGKQGEEHK